MGRRLVESVEVRRRDGVPEQFLWRSRLYVIRDVLEHWFESGRWWSSERAMALVSGSDGSGEAGTTAPMSGSLDDGEQEFWRVEAGPGRSASPGFMTFVSTGPKAAGSSWRCTTNGRFFD